jgi:predicted membrane-bound spermidine synthase
MKTSANAPVLPAQPGRTQTIVPSDEYTASGTRSIRSLSWFFVFFFISGFCSILYEIVWLRLAMAQFGVTSALVSIVLSMFMAGLGLGSWGSGRLIRKYRDGFRVPALRLYALIELLIGCSALIVPHELAWGRSLIERTGLSSSAAYYLASGIWVGLTLVPWCALMGATIPVAMLAIKQDLRRESQRSFSFLYLSNVLGAVAGATLPLLFIELVGFRGTLKVGAALNVLIALSVMALTLRRSPADAAFQFAERPAIAPASKLASRSKKPLLLLFATGFTSMGMELVWIRQFTPYLGTVVYAFASILATYLASTFLGSRIYRIWSRKSQPVPGLVWPLLGLAAFLPLIAANPEFHLFKVTRLALGVIPFSCLLGFVTPMLVDRWSEGDPDRAGRAYAINIIGCILGPLLSGFVLLPVMSERWALLALALPWLAIGLWPGWPSASPRISEVPVWQRVSSYVIVLASLAMVFTNRAFEDEFGGRSRVMRDNTATSIATGSGMKKNLLINGVGITGLSPAIKMMAHLPLSFLGHRPQNVLVICFGMGTTYRSMLSWGIPVTGVELVPSVPQLFGYYHEDGPALLRSPQSHVVIDDGRRFLERTNQQYDVIAIDPPPPVSAAGSSLLYSEEFYGIVKQHLRPGGILHQWLPGCDDTVRASAARALRNSFPYIRVFPSVGAWGSHFIASMTPIPNRTAKDLLDQMPPRAVEDMMEWGPETDPERHIAAVLNRELSINDLVAEAPDAPSLKDDRPVNEYFLWRMRKHFMKWLAG